MKILEITFIPPALNKGGGYLGIYQSIKSLLSIAEVDYIGPSFDLELFDNKIRNAYFLEKDTNFVCRFFNLFFRGITTSYYDKYRKVANAIDWSVYDAIHIDSSRYYFVLNDVHSYNKKAIVRFHNIEKEYAQALFNTNKTLNNLLCKVFFTRNERLVCNESDFSLFITSEDKNLAVKYYGYHKNNYIINPISLEEKSSFNRKINNSRDVNFLISGTLNHTPNMNGIIWFVENVWKKLKLTNIKLSIAGYEPPEVLRRLEKKNTNITIIDSPIDMHPYFESADVYVAPIFEGSGMKVKIAEALSEGLPVIGTPHAWIGYDSITKGKYIARNAQDFCNIISYIVEHIDMLRQDSFDIYGDFEEHLSMKKSIIRYNDALKQLLVVS